MTTTSLTIYDVGRAPFQTIPNRFHPPLTTERGRAQRAHPAWLENAITRLANLEGLSPGWDGNDGLPVGRVHANRAIRFLHRFMEERFPQPEIVPLADGGVQLEWHLPYGRMDFVTDTDSPEPILLFEPEGRVLLEFPARQVPDDVLRSLLAIRAEA